MTALPDSAYTSHTVYNRMVHTSRGAAVRGFKRDGFAVWHRADGEHVVIFYRSKETGRRRTAKRRFIGQREHGFGISGSPYYDASR